MWDSKPVYFPISPLRRGFSFQKDRQATVLLVTRLQAIDWPGSLLAPPLFWLATGHRRFAVLAMRQHAPRFSGQASPQDARP